MNAAQRVDYSLKRSKNSDTGKAHSGALLAQPGLQGGHERPAALGAHGHALLRRQAVNLALDGKQRIDARNRLAGDRRRVKPSQIEELAPGTWAQQAASTIGPPWRLAS